MTMLGGWSGRQVMEAGAHWHIYCTSFIDNLEVTSSEGLGWDGLTRLGRSDVVVSADVHLVAGPALQPRQGVGVGVGWHLHPPPLAKLPLLIQVEACQDIIQRI